jgi:hypothetical protein
MSTNNHYMSYYLTEATASQKTQFLNVYEAELDQAIADRNQPNLTPNTLEKMALWEAYCQATGADPTLPGPPLV